MEEKITPRLNDLSIIEFKDFATSLRNGAYSITCSEPTEDTVPEGIIKSFTTRDAYRYILDDPEADFECFALAFTSGKMSMVIPLGVYGVTAAHQVYFPLQINSFGRSLIMMSFDDFNAIYPTTSNGENKSRFALLLGAREELIKRIFCYYHRLGEKFNSVMAWAARNPGSPTRKIAERMMFKRVEFGDTDDRSEIYFTKDVQEDELRYLMECTSRWTAVFNEDQQKDRSSNPLVLSAEKFFLFYKIIAG